MAKENQEPFYDLGAKIKYFREQWQQSVSDVSGTLEIDERTLTEIEAGKTLPPDELLNLLINHFLLTDDQAEELRILAEQQRDQTSESLLGGIEDMLMKQIVMYLPIDTKIVYTDSMNATVNKHGVSLQFMQSSGPDNKPISVSHVGMSREHAEKMIKVLRSTLDQYDRNGQTKLLPSPNSQKPKKRQ